MEDQKRVRGCGPPPKYGSKSVVKAVRVPGQLWDQLDKKAKRTGVSRNELIVRTMQRSLAREPR